jgi:hypothetical protein
MLPEHRQFKLCCSTTKPKHCVAVIAPFLSLLLYVIQGILHVNKRIRMLLVCPITSGLTGCASGRFATFSTLRRLVSISLLVLLGLPFIPPLLALSARSETNLPPCCGRNGKHRCMMSMAERARHANRNPRFSTPEEKCPYGPTAVVATHGSVFTAPPVSAIFAGLVTHPTVTTQTESKLRISLNRSRQKRGPPASLPL